MRVLIVFESLFGNTRQIAEAIAEGARRASTLVDVSCIRVPDLVGASRSDHALEPGTEGPTLSEWLEQLPKARPGTMAVAFDTGLDRILSGGAAPKIERRLRGRGYTIAAAPEGFIVEDMEGPLRSGEGERAAAWGQMAVERLL